ncbi:MAG: prolyl oligopeptidase family serine peptidase [bacterium]
MKKKIYHRSALIIILTGLINAALAQKKTFSLEDILRLPTVGEVAVSPKGDWIAYTLSELDFEHNTTNVNISLVSTTAQNPVTRRLTNGIAQNTNPQWSPDGSALAFLSNRNEVPSKQVYLLSLAGGEAQQLTDIKSGVSLFRWSPDGTKIAFLCKDAPDSVWIKKHNEKDDAIVAGQNFQMTHLWIVEIATKTIRRVTSGAFTILDFSWAPDGKAIAYSAQPKPTHPPDYYESDLYIVDLSSGVSKKILAQPGKEISPLWAPDGKWIACISNGGVYDWIGNEYALLVNPLTGEKRNLTQNFDEVTRLASWSADGKALYFSAAQGILSKLFFVSIADQRIQSVTTGNDYCSAFSFTQDTRQMAFLKQNAQTPPEIYLSELRDFKPRKMTSIYANLQEFDVAATEVIQWTSKDEKYQIEGLLTKPHGFIAGKKYPLLVVAHGGPPSVFSNTFILRRLTYPAQLFSQGGFLMLYPNVRGSGGYGEQFRKANVNAWGGGDFEDLIAGVDYCIAKGWADPERLGIMGWSYGGYLTAMTIAKTNRFKAASVGAGITNVASYYGTVDIPDFVEAYFGAPPWQKSELYRERSAVLNADRIVTPALIQHGDQDDRVPLSQSQELYTALKKNGVPTEFIIYPREWHILSEPKHQRDALLRNYKWFRRWLADSAATETIAPGVMRRFMAKAQGPWRINVLEIDLKQAGLEIESARAMDHFLGRETTRSIAARHNDSLRQVIAALNADFFDLKTGEIENNQIIAGEFVKGVKITGSPHDTFDNIHSQFALSFDGRPFIERFAFNGKVIWRDGSVSDLSGVNTVPDSNALVIFNHYYGTAAPRDSLRFGVTEIELAQLTEMQDTLIYRVQKKFPQSGGAAIPRTGLILAGYHDAQKLLARKLAIGDTIKMILGLSPSRDRIKTLAGGWPRIVVDGKNSAAGADSSEGTFPRFSANRHPRSGVGFSADSTKLYLLAVDGRQEASAGMSLVEFADLMISLGIYQGLNLDGGGSTTLVINGKIVNSPSDRSGERAVGNCLLLLLRGSPKR